MALLARRASATLTLLQRGVRLVLVRRGRVGRGVRLRGVDGRDRGLPLPSSLSNDLCLPRSRPAGLSRLKGGNMRKRPRSFWGFGALLALGAVLGPIAVAPAVAVRY